MTGPRRVPTGCSKPACPGSTPPATCAQGRSSAARPRWARARWSSSSSTRGSPPYPPERVPRRTVLGAPPSPAPRNGDPQPTTAVELLFDLVYVFAITQISHLLIHHLDLGGAGQAAFLLLVVWWAWIYTTWMVNWFDPGSGKVRLVLVLARAGQPADGGGDPDRLQQPCAAVRGAYVAMQVGRNVAATALLARDARAARRASSGSSPGAWSRGRCGSRAGSRSSALRLALWGAALADRPRRADPRLLDARAAAVRARRLPGRGWSFRRALSVLHHHRARRVDRRDRRDRHAAAGSRRSRCSRSRSPSSSPAASGGCTSGRWPSTRAASWPRPRTRASCP